MTGVLRQASYTYSMYGNGPEGEAAPLLRSCTPYPPPVTAIPASECYVIGNLSHIPYIVQDEQLYYQMYSDLNPMSWFIIFITLFIKNI